MYRLNELLSTGGSVFNGYARWDFTLGCPNKAAAILAPALLLALAAVMRVRNRYLAAALTLSASAIAFALIRTFSRGGFLAFAAAAAALIICKRRDITAKKRWPHLLAVAAVIVTTTVATGFASRIARSAPGTDASAGNRLIIWKYAAQMMVDAPGGWGAGQAGAAYMSWYQPLDRREYYRTLVNSPLTYLVESGWGRRWLAAALSILLGLVLVRRMKNGDALPAAIWICFSVSAVFSTVAENRLVWVIPVLVLLPAAMSFARSPRRTGKAAVGSILIAAGVSAVGAAAVCAAVTLFALMTDGTQIGLSRDGRRLIVGDGSPKSWIVYDAEALGGGSYGRTLRKWMRTDQTAPSAVGIVSRLEDIPEEAESVVICGAAASKKAAEKIAAAAVRRQIRVLSPPDPEMWLGFSALQASVYCGEFSPSCPFDDRPGLIAVPNCGQYLPEWPRLAFGPPEL